MNPRGQAWGRSGIHLHLLCSTDVMESEADTEHNAIGILWGLRLLMKQGLSFKETCHCVEWGRQKLLPPAPSSPIWQIHLSQSCTTLLKYRRLDDVLTALADAYSLTASCVSANVIYYRSHCAYQPRILQSVLDASAKVIIPRGSCMGQM